MVDTVNFWNWFKINCRHLHSNKYPNDTFKELDKRVYSMGLYWEVGPGVKKENLLTISVSGRRELLDKARSLLANAPILDDWEFDLLKKPKKNWDKLEIPGDNIKISAANWTYVLLKYEDGKKEILIKADTLSDFEKDKRIELAEIVLTNLIGEEKLMDELNYLDVLEVEDSTYETQDIRDLEEHLDYLKNDA
ncbi:MAG TPA: hypothetical protein VIN08_27220 [Ohtaekwangia sp.]|uniref:hypothetical protein n=1 Tax=Ohtaekwangia sp. TaxID=2066019 RepID=UPI002F958F5C